MKRMTGKLQRHPAPGGSDNPQDLVRVRLGVTSHQRVTEQEPRRLSSLGEGVPDGRGIRRRRPPRRGSQVQRRRAATAAGMRCPLHRRRASGPASLRRGAGTSRQRSMARRAGGDEDSARRYYQAGDPGHAMSVKFRPPPSPSHTAGSTDQPHAGQRARFSRRLSSQSAEPDTSGAGLRSRPNRCLFVRWI